MKNRIIKAIVTMVTMVTIAVLAGSNSKWIQRDRQYRYKLYINGSRQGIG